MNSHDKGVAYALNSTEARQRIQFRANWIADVTDAIHNGFKAEPDLAPCHLPLLSDDALERVFKESEKWRDKSHERALEARIQTLIDADEKLNGYYVNLRGILDALDVPNHFRPIDGNPKHIAWTEQKARELVKKADDSDRNRRAAVDAEQRVELLERYVKECDDKRLPYNWNVFKMGTGALRDLVWWHSQQEKITNCETDHERIVWSENRSKQDTEQSLRWHARNAEKCRKLIEQLTGTRFGADTAGQLLDALLDRPQTGEQSKDWQPAGDWIVWEWQYKPNDLPDDQVVEIRTYGGGENILEAGVVEWSDVEKYRRVK